MRIQCSIVAMALLAATASCGDDAPKPRLPAAFPAKAVDPSTSSADSNPQLIELPSIALPKPATWIYTKPTMAFRTLQYIVPGAGGDDNADLIVSVFKAGDGGTLDANIDRWRNQFLGASGAPADPVRSQRTIAGAAVTRVDLKGSWKGMGMNEARANSAQLAAAIELPKETIYIRLVGPEKTVESARKDFEAMIDGLKLRTASLSK